MDPECGPKTSTWNSYTVWRSGGDSGSVFLTKMKDLELLPPFFQLDQPISIEDVGTLKPQRLHSGPYGLSDLRLCSAGHGQRQSPGVKVGPQFR